MSACAQSCPLHLCRCLSLPLAQSAFQHACTLTHTCTRTHAPAHAHSLFSSISSSSVFVSCYHCVPPPSFSLSPLSYQKPLFSSASLFTPVLSVHHTPSQLLELIVRMVRSLQHILYQCFFFFNHCPFLPLRSAVCRYLMQTMHKPIVFHVPGAVGELNNTATLLICCIQQNISTEYD